MTKNKYNIFDVLNNINKKQQTFSDLTLEEQKALQPLVIMRWMTGSDDARQIVFLNELVNPFVFPLGKHKRLLINLLNISSSGINQRYKWKKNISKKTPSHINIVRVISDFFGYSTKDSVEVLPLLHDNDIISFAEQLGRQPKEIKEIKKELKIRNKQ